MTVMSLHSPRFLKLAAAAALALGLAVTAHADPPTPDEGATPPSKPRLTISGFAQLDFIYDFKHSDPDWKSALRSSKIPINYDGPEGETSMSVKQSRLAFDGYTPTDIGELHAKIDFDFFGVGVDAGQTTFRLRNAYGELGPVLAGQANSVFMDVDVFPNIIEYWGPTGMVFLRNPQIRYTSPTQNKGRFAVSIEAPGSAVDSGKVADVDPELDLVGRTKLPDLAANYRYTDKWGHAQLAGILTSLGYQSASSTDGEPSGTKMGWGLSLSGVANAIGKDTLTGQVTYGEGIANFMNDGGVDLAPSADLKAETVPTLGFVIYYSHVWDKAWSTTFGYSQHTQDNTDGQLDDAFKTGSYATVNALWQPVKDFMTGAEFQWGEIENKGGDTGTDYRLQISAKYSFSS
jgi:hypothetical protein